MAKTQNLSDDDKARMAQLTQAVNMLREHFDAVQICATCADGDRSLIMHHGSGNLFTRSSITGAWSAAMSDHLVEETYKHQLPPQAGEEEDTE